MRAMLGLTRFWSRPIRLQSGNLHRAWLVKVTRLGAPLIRVRWIAGVQPKACLAAAGQRAAELGKQQGQMIGMEHWGCKSHVQSSGGLQDCGAFEVDERDVLAHPFGNAGGERGNLFMDAH